MNPENEVTSAAEDSHNVTSAAKVLKIEVTSDAEGPEIEVISAADGLENEVTAAEQGPEIEATSAANGPVIEVTSAAEGPEIKVASAAEDEVFLRRVIEDADVEDDEEDADEEDAEGPEIEVMSAADGLENEVTAAEQGPEIEATSAANGPVIEVTSAAEGPEIKVASATEDEVFLRRRVIEDADVEDDEEDAFLRKFFFLRKDEEDAEGPENEVISAADGRENEVTAAEQGPEIEATSAANGPVIEVTSAAEGPEIKVASAAEDEAFLRRRVIEDADVEDDEEDAFLRKFFFVSRKDEEDAEGPENEVISAADGLENKVTAAEQGPEIEATSAANGPVIEEGPEIKVVSAAEDEVFLRRRVIGDADVEDDEEDAFLRKFFFVSGKDEEDAEGPEIKVASAAEDEVPLRRRVIGDADVEDDEEDGDAVIEEGPTEVPVGIEKRSQWARNSICRAPRHMRYGGGSDFEPKLVSIGPYYHGRENLKPMEELKLRCMSDLLKMQQVGESSIHRSISDSDLKKQPVGVSIDISEVPVRPFIELESHARLSYKEKFDHDDYIFVRMLVLDSCFIIRIMLSLCEAVQESMTFLDLNIKEVRSDLLLLENQIPLTFIESVYDWLFPHWDHPKFPPFNAVVELFIWLDMPWNINHGGMSSEAAHLLDLYWQCSSSPMINEELNNFRKDRPEKEKPTWVETHLLVNTPKVIENATLLHQMAGINFEKLNDQGHEGLNVIFSKGIMRMPCLKMDSSQTTLFLNLIAFENFMAHDMRTFSSYIKLMDDLIDSEKDVELLQQSGVIYNRMSSHKMAATVFNDIGNFCMIDYDKQLQLYRDVKEYYDSSWNRRRASLQNNYCSSPWACISVFAGVTLLILTVLQTFYTIYGYYNPMH